MTDKITDQPEGATPLDDISGLLRDDITTRGQLDEAEGLNIVNAVEWLERRRFPDVFTVEFYQELHSRMYDQVWSWAGVLRSETGRCEGRKPVPDEVVLEARKLRRKNGRTGRILSLRKIACRLADMGYVAPSGNPYGAESVKRMVAR
jgi:fido (protein-threonine AMPylation protein)